MFVGANVLTGRSYPLVPKVRDMSTDSPRISPDGTQRSRLRADALHNRDRILDAARKSFAARGLDVPMAAIARRAGVGVATLYRHFPTRESLITEVFTEQLTHCSSVIDDALAEPDPWRGFHTAVERICAMQVIDRGFTAAFRTEFPDSADFERVRVRAERGFAELVRRAKTAGKLRADFSETDLTLTLLANGGVTAETPHAASAASARLVAHLLRAFRTDDDEPAAPLPPPAPLRLERVARLAGQ